MPVAQPPQPVQIVPWLQWTPSPILWGVLTLAALIAAWALLGTRRSGERFPLSPRWFAVTLVVTLGVYAALSWGNGAINTAAFYTAPLPLLVSLLPAWCAWHAPQTEEGSARSTLAGAAMGTVILAGLPLAGQWLLVLATRGETYDLHPGAGLANSIGRIAPGLATAPLLLLLLPSEHPRFAGVRRALTGYTGVIVVGLTAILAAGAMTGTTPLGEQAGLGERFRWIGPMASLVPFFGLLGLLPLLAASQGRQLGRVIAPLIAVASAVGLCAFLLYGTPHAEAGVRWWQAGFCFAFAIVSGTIVIWVPVGYRLKLLLAGVCVFILVRSAQLFADHAATPWTFWFLTACGMMGLFSASLAATASRPPPTLDPVLPPSSAPALTAAALLGATILLAPLTVRSSLTWQAEHFGRTFNWESSRQTDPEMREIIKGRMHALAQSTTGTRWAWTTPQSTWWHRSGDWRDALIVPDQTQPGLRTPVTPGVYYSGRIVGSDRKPADTPFTEAENVMVVQPTPRGQPYAVVTGKVASRAAPTELLDWAQAGSPTWVLPLCGVLGGVLGWLVSMPGRGPKVQVVAVILPPLLFGPLIGLGAAGAVLVGVRISGVLSATRKDDPENGVLLLTFVGTGVVALCPLVLHLSA